jgi:hypothetical protein
VVLGDAEGFFIVDDFSCRVPGSDASMMKTSTSCTFTANTRHLTGELVIFSEKK